MPTSTNNNSGRNNLSSEYKKDQNMWAMFCHLSGLLIFFFPIGNIVAPLIIRLTKKDEFPLVDDQGKEAINFQISMTICFIISSILIFVLIGIIFLIALAIIDVIVIVTAAVKASNGIKYRYPMTIKFVK